MNNRFTEYAEDFLDRNYAKADEEKWDDEELEDNIRAFLSHKGLDSAWMDEAVEVIKEHWHEWS